MKLLEERNHQPGGILSAVLQRDQRNRNQDAGRDLISQLGARRKTKIAAMNNFEVVVGKADGAKG